MKTLKVIGGVLALAALTLTGCENYKEELAQMTQNRDSLMAVANEKDLAIDEFMTSFEEIESGLTAITEKQQLLKKEAQSETGETRKAKIQKEIAFLGQLLDESKTKTDELSRKLKNSNFKVAKFEKMIVSLNEQIKIKDEQLLALNTEIGTLNTKVEALTGSVAELETRDAMNNRIISDQTAKMNRAYIAVGDYKKLRDDKVVTREGGFLGLGKEEKLSAGLNPQAFSEVDITRIQTIPLDTKEAELVTVHPAGSYSLERQNNKVSELVITDADKFWSTGKYLVVMTK